MPKKYFQIKGETVEDVKRKIESQKSQIPKDFYLLEEPMISPGEKSTTIGLADTTEAAFEEAKTKVPSDASIVGKRISPPDRKVIIVYSLDEQSAEASARVKARVPTNYRVRDIKLKALAKKGFLGLGKKSNRYEVEFYTKAMVEITYKTQARAGFTIADLNGIIENLKHSSWDTRRKAAEILGAIGNQQAIEPLVALLKDRECQFLHGRTDACFPVREAAARALIRIGQASVEPTLALLKEDDWHTRNITVEVLTSLGWQPTDDTQQAAKIVAQGEWSQLVDLGAVSVKPLILVLQTGQTSTLVRISAAKTLTEVISNAVKEITSDDLLAATRIRDVTKTKYKSVLVSAADEYEDVATTEIIFDCSQIREMVRQELAWRQQV